MAYIVGPGVGDNSVHFDGFVFGAEFGFTACIPQMASFYGFPFVFVQPVQICGINFGPEALCKFDVCMVAYVVPFFFLIMFRVSLAAEPAP